MAHILFKCFRNCFDHAGYHATTVIDKDAHQVFLDANFIGHEVVIIKDGLRACGSGGVVGNVPIVQSKSYFEVKIQQSGIWGVGLATQKADLNSAPGGNDSESWVYCHDGAIRHNNKELHKMEKYANEGDVVGVTFDHIELNFFVNGVCIDTSITGIRGDVYPVIFDDGAILDLIVDDFTFPPPNGFQRIMIEQSLL